MIWFYLIHKLNQLCKNQRRNFHRNRIGLSGLGLIQKILRLN